MTTVKTVVAPVFKTLEAAKSAASLKGKKISHTEALKISKAINQAMDEGFKKLGPEDLFQELPYALGMDMMRSIKKSDFVKSADFNKLWNLSVDIASAAPDIGNYIPD